MIQTVQRAIQDSAYRTGLAQALSDAGCWQVVSVSAPDPQSDGVIVVDAQALDRFQGLLAKPERVVLITHKDPQHLARAWDAGVISVVFEDDPIGTAMLAVMSAGLRAPHERPPVEPIGAPGVDATQAPVRRSKSRAGAGHADFPCRCGLHGASGGGH